MFTRSPQEDGYRQLLKTKEVGVGVAEDQGCTSPDDVSTDDDEKTMYAQAYRARLAMGRLFLSIPEMHMLSVQTNSVYGSAIVMPQIARSAGWPARLTVVCMRCYFLLALNTVMQWMLIYSIMKEEQVMDLFGGQMWQCDFAARKDGCPEADGCRGPDGTRITPSRLYNFEQWIVQKFVKDAFLQIFPDHADDIRANVDPGEYGVESAECRWLSTLLFVIAVMQDFRDCLQILRLLWHLPRINKTWVDEDADGEVQVQICGMPGIWKAINLFTVLIPKIMLWQFTCGTGMIFLLETSGIDNVIINATALVFILDIDELLFATFSSPEIFAIMESLDGYDIAEENTRLASSTSQRDSNEDADANSSEILDKSKLTWFCSMEAFPTMVFLVALVFWYFHSSYYAEHCFQSKDGTYVSNPMYVPKTTEFSFLSAFLPSYFPIEAGDDEPYWQWKE